MDIDQARAFLRDHHRAVLATRRQSGGVQMSPLLVALDAEGRAIISSVEGAFKVRNLRRDPRAELCVLGDDFYGEWIQVDGTATVVSLPEAMEPLVEYYRSISGEHPDWDEYRAAMRSDRRVAICIDIESAGPNRQA